jgi:hypothetical protein
MHGDGILVEVLDQETGQPLTREDGTAVQRPFPPVMVRELWETFVAARDSAEQARLDAANARNAAVIQQRTEILDLLGNPAPEDLPWSLQRFGVPRRDDVPDRLDVTAADLIALLTMARNTRP